MCCPAGSKVLLAVLGSSGGASSSGSVSQFSPIPSGLGTLWAAGLECKCCLQRLGPLRVFLAQFSPIPSGLGTLWAGVFY